MVGRPTVVDRQIAACAEGIVRAGVRDEDEPMGIPRIDTNATAEEVHDGLSTSGAVVVEGVLSEREADRISDELAVWRDGSIPGGAPETDAAVLRRAVSARAMCWCPIQRGKGRWTSSSTPAPSPTACATRQTPARSWSTMRRLNDPDAFVYFPITFAS
jgi:hypothetical protein